MKVKRIISILLTLAIVLGLSPTTFAADNTLIEEVSIVVNGMEPGNTTTDVSVPLPEGVNYTVNRIEVFDMDGEPITAPLEADRYIVRVTLYSAKGYTFSRYADLYMEDLEPDLFYSNDSNTVLYMEQIYDLRAHIDRVELTVTGMAEGNYATDIQVTVPDDAAYTVEDFTLYDSNYDEFTGTFAAGWYYVNLDLVPADGCYFTSDTFVFVNDSLITDFGVSSWGTLLYLTYEQYLISYPIEWVQAELYGVELGERTTDIEVYTYEDSNYDCQVHEIYTVEDDSRVPFSGTFGAGTYEVVLRFTAHPGFTFGNENSSISYYIEADGCADYSRTYTNHTTLEITVYYTLVDFDQLTPIEQVEVTLTGMEKGKTPADVKATVPAGANYTIGQIQVLDIKGEPFTGTFDSGPFDSGLYLASIPVIPADGYYFGDSVEVLLNDHYVTWIFNDYNSIILETELELRTLIDKVEVTVTGMEKGKSAADVTITLPTGAKYTVDCPGIYAYSNSDEVFTGTFENDLYIADIFLTPDAGYRFNYNTQVTINGGKYDSPAVANFGTYIYLEHHLELRTPIDKVDVIITNMEEGKSAEDVQVTVPAGANYQVEAFELFDQHWNIFTDTFEAGSAYHNRIDVYPADGYYFSEDVEVTINGNPLSNVYYDGNGLDLDYTLELRTPIDKVDITITGTEKGKSPNDVQITLPTDANYQLTSTTIYDSSWDEFTGTFAADWYCVGLDLEPADGYYFTNDAKVTINGSDPYYYYMPVRGTYLSLEHAFDLRTPITQIELPAWPTAPKAGDTIPDFGNVDPTGKNYSYVTLWSSMDEPLMPGNKFTNNALCYHMVCFSADDGYVFADDVTITVGGTTFTGFTIHEGDEVYIVKSYTIGSPKVIDQINLSGRTPTVGKMPGDITTSDTNYTLEDFYWGVANNGNGSSIETPSKPFQVGDYAYLAFAIQPADGYTFDLDCNIRFNGKSYSLMAEYTGINDDGSITIAICLGKVRDGSTLTGDFTGDDKVTDADVIYLLWHTVFPEDYPIEGDADFTGDNKVTDADVIYLLWHTVFPEDYPL